MNFSKFLKEINLKTFSVLDKRVIYLKVILWNFVRNAAL